MEISSVEARHGMGSRGWIAVEEPCLTPLIQRQFVLRWPVPLATGLALKDLLHSGQNRRKATMLRVDGWTCSPSPEVLTDVHQVGPLRPISAADRGVFVRLRFSPYSRSQLPRIVEGPARARSIDSLCSDSIESGSKRGLLRIGSSVMSDTAAAITSSTL